MNKINPIHAMKNRRVSRSCTLILGMAELCPAGLSEQWLLRFGGDVHWSLIAQALGQKIAKFCDAYGREVYAAFCATSIELAPTIELLAKSASISSTLYHVGNHQIGSIHQIEIAGDRVATLSMISTFVSHQEDKLNSRIVRNKDMPELYLEEAPDKLAFVAKNARAIARNNFDHMLNCEMSMKVTPCPSVDFNAVGLLYFPSFSKFSEIAEWKQKPTSGQLKQRDVVYLGNLDIGGSLEVATSGNRSSIIRDDGIVIAHMLTTRYAP